LWIAKPQRWQKSDSMTTAAPVNRMPLADRPVISPSIVIDAKSSFSAIQRGMLIRTFAPTVTS
jgi:hypothetical protein